MELRKTVGRLDLRQWVELLLGTAALAVSAISLWVATGTEEANRQMVAAASWPFLTVDSSNVPENGQPVITFVLTNGGIGPAKLRTIEISWRGKAYMGAKPFLEACCGFKAFTGPSDLSSVGRTPVTTGGLRNTVILAGEKRTFLRLPRGPDNVAVWRKLDVARRELKFRACYCSVFDECWVSTLVDLEPNRVKVCPEVKVPYVE